MGLCTISILYCILNAFSLEHNPPCRSKNFVHLASPTNSSHTTLVKAVIHYQKTSNDNIKRYCFCLRRSQFSQLTETVSNMNFIGKTEIPR